MTTRPPAFSSWPEAAFFQQLLQRPASGRRRVWARTPGTHHSQRHGLGESFRDHRPYAPGDDLRHMNWRLMAHLGTPVVRQFEAEATIPLQIVLDVSASMGVGQPSKLHLAWRLAAAFAFCAYAARDEVTVWLARDELTRLRLAIPPLPAQLAEALFCQEAKGKTDLARVAHTLVHAGVPTGATLIWLSDFLDAAAIETVCGVARRASQVPIFVQVEAAADIDPAGRLPVGQLLALQDAETNQSTTLTLTTAQIDAYLKQHKLHNEALERFCARNGIRLLRVRSDAPFESTALRLLAQTGLHG